MRPIDQRRFGEMHRKVTEDRRDQFIEERRIAEESQMEGCFYRRYVADNRPMKPYGDSPNLRPIQW